MSRKYVFLVNPISGTGGKASLSEVIRAAAEVHRANVEILPTVASGDYRFLRARIKEEGITDIVICGGDGTVNQVVQNLRTLKINFGIVPLGSGNGLAFSAGIPKNVRKALDVVFTGRASYVDAFEVNNDFACMLCGVGFDAQVAHDFAHQKKRGLITYTKQTLKNYFSADPYPFTIVAGETVISTKAYFISIANSNQFGNMVTIAPGASLSDGLLDIVIVPKMNKAVLPLAILQQVNGGKPQYDLSHIDHSKIIYFQVDKLQVRNPSRAPLHLDGEPRETDASFEVQVIPRCFRLIQPIR